MIWRKKQTDFKGNLTEYFLLDSVVLWNSLSNSGCAVLIWSPFIVCGAWNTIVYFHVWQCSLVFSSWHIALWVEFLTLEGEVVWRLESIRIWSLFLLILSIASVDIHKDMVLKIETTGHTIHYFRLNWEWALRVKGNEALATSLGY